MATPVNLLQLSPTMTEGTIVRWLVKEGDPVSSGQPIAEVETDKAVMEQESFEDGKVLKVMVKEGDRVPVGSLIMVTGNPGEDISSLLADSSKEKKAAAPAEAKAKVAPAPAAAPVSAPAPAAAPAAPQAASAPTADGRILASPLARKMAEDAGLDLSLVHGSGPAGRVIKRDVEEAIEKGVTAPPPAAPDVAAAAASVAPVYTPPPSIPVEAPAEAEVIKLSGMRQTIARRLLESKQTIPHFQLTIEVRGEKLLDAVARVREVEPDAKLTVTHFLIKAMASCAMKNPAIRTQFGGDKLIVLPAAHISVAVAIDEGLVTPVIRNAHGKGVVQIARELRELAEKARARKLTAEDFAGGVQTISNLGMYGIHEFNAIINPPESSILAISAMEERPVVEQGRLTVGKVMKITMSCDHRVIDGAVGAKYLDSLKKALEEPLFMLL